MDTLKIEIREITSVYCRNKAKSTRKNLRNLEKDLEFKIKLKDDLQYNDENLDKDINDLEHKISKIYENKAKGAQMGGTGRKKQFLLFRLRKKETS